MITEHAASAGRGKGNHHEIRIDGLSHRDDDRDQDAEGPPCRARGEAQKARNQKHDGGEERPGYASVRHKGLHENRRLEKSAADTADRPCQHQNDVGGQHGLHAFNGPVHKLSLIHIWEEGIGGPGHKGAAERSRVFNDAGAVFGAVAAFAEQGSKDVYKRQPLSLPLCKERHCYEERCLIFF